MDVAQLVGSTIARLGAAHAFGVVGSGNFAVTNALRAGGVPFVACRHEGGAITMADAFARMSGRVAVVSTHQGCGFTNTMTGLGEAAKSRTPLLVLTADTANGAVRSNFRIDQDAAARSVGAVAERVHTAETAFEDTVRAFTTALRERRTVVLNLPLDVQVQQVEPPPDVRPPEPAGVIRPTASAVAALADAVARARRPVFVAGRGARAAAAELRAVAELTGALLATSAVANGLFHDEPWSLGISGGFASPLAAELISGADLIVGWGCALNMWTMRHGRLIGPGATVVQVDVEQSALGADRAIDLGVLGDVGQTARDLHAELTRRGHRTSGYRGDEVRDRIAAEVRWRDVPFPDLSTDERIDPRTLSARLDELLPEQRVVALDSGNFMGYPAAYLSVPDEHGFCFTQAFQSIGLGLATAIGAALAQPDRLPVAAVGDGGFLMSVAEMDTVVRLGLPMVVVVYNDSAYGAEVHHFTDSTDDELAAVRFPETDIAAIGRGFGATAVTVRTEDDLAAVGDWLTGDRATPLVIDAKIASDGGAWWLAEAFHRH